MIRGSNRTGNVHGSELDTTDDVRHGSRAVGLEDLDGDDIGLLGDTVILGGDGTGACWWE